MDWEVINGITGLISAFCAIAGIGYFTSHSAPKKRFDNKGAFSLAKIIALVTASSGWALCCLCYLWIFEPYGWLPTDREYRQFFGIILFFPALITLKAGVELLFPGKEK